MVGKFKEVYFAEYCKHCMYEKKNHHKEPCNECLTYGARENSHKPLKFMLKSGQK